MTAANLIPTPRRKMARQRAKTRRWTAVCAGYGASLAAAYGALTAAWSYDRAGLERSVQTAAEENAARRADISSLTAQAQSVQKQLAANRAVGNQPNWSVLLTVVGRAMRDDTFLRRCQLSRTVQAAPAPRATPAGASPAAAGEPLQIERLSLRLSGLAATQAGVSAVALRLEDTGLFSRVELMQSRREAFGGVDAVAFEFECAMADGER